MLRLAATPFAIEKRVASRSGHARDRRTHQARKCQDDRHLRPRRFTRPRGRDSQPRYHRGYSGFRDRTGDSTTGQPIGTYVGRQWRLADWLTEDGPRNAGTSESTGPSTGAAWVALVLLLMASPCARDGPLKSRILNRIRRLSSTHENTTFKNTSRRLMPENLLAASCNCARQRRNRGFGVPTSAAVTWNFVELHEVKTTSAERAINVVAQRCLPGIDTAARWPVPQSAFGRCNRCRF